MWGEPRADWRGRRACEAGAGSAPRHESRAICGYDMTGGPLGQESTKKVRLDLDDDCRERTFDFLIALGPNGGKLRRSIWRGFPRRFPYRRYQECVHCGLCTASCPTYIETCDENDSPRGRIYSMRAIADGRLAMGPGVREHLELCLDCRACESACPSGVQYGKMIEPFKIALASSAQVTRRRAGSSG